MMRRERERARRIAEYVDALLIHRRRRQRQLHADTPADREFRELARLAGALSRIDVVPREEFASELRNQLPGIAAAAESARSEPIMRSAGTMLRAAVSRIWRLDYVMRTVTATAVLVVLAFVVVSEISTSKTVSAAQILTRADATLAEQVRPGTVLYQRWRVADIRRAVDGRETTQERFIDEWLDGSDLQHVAGRWMTTSGQLLTAYSNVREDGEYRGRVYFAPSATNGPRGLLSIEPTRREFQQAAEQFSYGDRLKLNRYLARDYIYEPIVGERRFNRAVIEHTAGDASIAPRMRLSLDDSGVLGGAAVYKVRVIDPLRVRFRWTASGPPAVWLEQHETLRYISRDTYLTLKTEDDHRYETGERVSTTRELVETRIAAGGSTRQTAFDLEVPAGTAVRTQSAFEQLAAVAAALNRAPVNQLTEERQQ